MTEPAVKIENLHKTYSTLWSRFCGTSVEALRGIPRSLDWLAAKTRVSAGEPLACLTAMSFKGWVVEEAGGRYRLLSDAACR